MAEIRRNGSGDLSSQKRDEYIERSRALIGYSQWIFDNEIKRAERIDVKVSWCLAASVLLLGLSVNWIPIVARDSPGYTQPQREVVALFSVAFIVLTVIAVVSFSLCLGFRKIRAYPLGESVMGVFVQEETETALFQVAKSIMSAAEQNSLMINCKTKRAKWGFMMLATGLLFFSSAAVGYCYHVVF